MKQYKTLKRSKVLPLLIQFVERHINFKNCYFWSPPSNASGRRRMEDNNTLKISFNLGGVSYSFTQEVRCSCQNVYYSSSIDVGEKTKDIRAVKKLIALYS